MESVDYVTFWESKNVFVTGASGLVGSWLVKELLEKKANIFILMRDRIPTSELALSGNINKVVVVDGSLENYKTLLQAFKENKIDTCFHLGAQTIVQTAARSPLSTFETNIKGTWNLLEAARLSNIRAVVVASSDKAYGDSPTLPYTEDMPLLGSNLYDVSKVCTDLIAATYHNTYGLRVCISRCGNIFGGGDLNFNRIVPGTIKSLLKDETPIIRSDGTLIRDYLYVKDAVSAYLALGEQTELVEGQAFNFGTNKPLSVMELTQQIMGAVGKQIKPKILNQAKNEIQSQYLSSEKAHKTLKWSPKYSLKEALQETVEWYKNFLKL
jgi:CDP-glucose 4,6-dehydratase